MADKFTVYTELVRAALESKISPNTELSPEERLEAELLTPSSTFTKSWLSVLHPQEALIPEKLAPKVAQLPPYDPRVRLHFERSGLDGHIGALKIVPVPAQQLQGVGGGMAMTRRMGSRKNAVRGKSGQMPFTPGGLDISEVSAASELHRSKQGLLDIAPGLSRPAKIGASQPPTSSLSELNLTSNMDLQSDLFQCETNDSSDLDSELDSEPDSELDSDTNVETETESISSEQDESLPSSKFDDIDSLLPPTSSFVRDMTQFAQRKPDPKEKTWAHMVDINRDMSNFNELVPNPARTWPFELDNFQKEAVYHLEQGDSVFIAAHTSAGKTVVAEYAMSMAAQHMTKCIYTSPIKALSNQKYRDFKKEYDDVGILTGDVQLNPDASTLIMTTEILRSMLYRGADIIRDVEFIIFDEVHYVNDSERGVVWEEVIIMLPDHVKLVLLSATVPNTYEFANWVGRTKEKDVYVISTPKRPVPLQHNLWVKNQIIELVGEDRKFNATNYHLAEELVAPKKPASAARGGSTSGGRGGNRGGGNTARGGGNSHRGRGGSSSGQQALQKQMGPQKGRFNSGPATKTDMLNLVEYLRKNQLLPAVMFVFSRKQCEQYATNLQSAALNTSKERSQVHMFMEKAVSRLRKEDRELPQIQTLRALLQLGIGVHHSGLLPIMKEVVEILFARGLVKLLFATETFAMGLNLPTRTVVFTSVKKFDSKTMRYLSPGEYTQMAGRAGRRGLDTVGTVIIMNTSKDEVVPSASLNLMILGSPFKLSSQFRLTYNMILSLLRIEALRVEDVIQQSFSENNQHVMRPEREKRLITLEKSTQDARQEMMMELEKSHFDDTVSTAMMEYHKNASSYHELTLQAYSGVDLGVTISKVRYCFYRSYGNSTLMIGVLYDTGKRHKNKNDELQFGVVTLGTLQDFDATLPYFATKVNVNKNPHPRFVPFSELKHKLISFGQIEMISCVRVPVNVKKLTEKLQNELVKLYHTNIDAIYTEISMKKLRLVEARLALRDREQAGEQLQISGAELENILKANGINTGLSKKQLLLYSERLYAAATKIYAAEQEAADIRASVTVSNTALLPDYEQRMNVLKKANYVDEGLNVALKGRVACEISTGYELYVTELIMDNFLGSYEPEEIVALLSVFVFEGARGAEDPPTVTPRLDEGKARLLELVEYVQNLATENQVALTQDEAEFSERNRFALMQVVYEWARGMTFSEITTLTTVQEGLIVRVINRLDEVCRSVMSAARIIGEVDLYDKLAIAQERIKRDIVFCSSLYL